MTYEELDKIVRELEPQEDLLYNHIIKEPDYSRCRRQTVNGEEIMVLDNGASQTFKNCPHPFVSIHKNSRFTDMPAHIHGGIEISYIYSGTCVMTIGTQTFTLKKGQFLLMDSAIPHSVDNKGQMNDILISIIIESNFLQDSIFHHLATGDIVSDFLSNAVSAHASHNTFILFHSENNRRLPIYINELMIEHLEPSLNASDVITHLLQLTFLELMNLYGQENSIYSNMMSSHLASPNLVPILNYISDHYRNCTLKSTAQHFGMSPAYMTTILKKSTGLSFKELIQKQRFSCALSLLKNTDMPVELIAASVGYDTTTYFYKKFKESFGCTPREYRLNQQSECRITSSPMLTK